MRTTGTTASFEMGSFQNSLKDIKGFGPTILHNANGIEELLEFGASQLFDGDRLSKIKDSILNMLAELRAKPEFIDLDSIKQVVGQVKEKIEDALGGVPIASFDIDLSDALRELKKILPDDMPGIDLSELKPKVEAIVDKLTDSGISYKVLKENPAFAAKKDSPDATQTGKPALSDRGKSNPPAPAQESPFEKSLNDFFTKPELSASLDPLSGKIEGVIADSGIMLELEEHLTALRDSFTNTKPLTLDLIITEIAKAAQALGGMLIDLLEGIITLIIDSIKDLYEKVKSLGDGLSGQIKDAIALLGIGEIEKPGPFTLPAVLLAIPVTLIHKTKIDFPDYSGILQEAFDVRTRAGAYGGVQIADGVVSTGFGLADLHLEEKNIWKVVAGISGRTLGFIAGGLAQAFSVPDTHNYLNPEKRKDATKDFPTIIWEYQLGILGWSFLRIFGYGFFAIRAHGAVDNSRKRALKVWNFADSFIVFGLETAHLVLFSIQFDCEEREDDQVSSTDRRLGAASIIDPLPGIINSLFAPIAMGLDYFSKDPAAQIQAVNSAVTTIGTETARVGVGSIGEKLTAQRVKLQVGGAVRNALDAALNACATNPNGPVQTEFDRISQVLTQNGPGTLKRALDDAKALLGVPSTIETDFNAAAGSVDGMKQKIDGCLADFDAINREYVKAINARPMPSDPALSFSIKDKLFAFLDHTEQAKKGLKAVQSSLANQQSDQGDLNQARRTLLPGQGPHNPNTITAVRNSLDAFHVALVTALQSFTPLFNTRLAAARTAGNQGILFANILATDLDPQNATNGSIGKCLVDISTSLNAFRGDFTNMANDNTPRAIETRMPGVITQKNSLRQALNRLEPLLHAQTYPAPNPLEQSVRTMADTFNRDGNDNFSQAYRSLLEFIHPDAANLGNAGVKNIGAIREIFAAALAVADTQLKAFQEVLDQDISNELRTVDRKLNRAKSDLKSALKLIPAPTLAEHQNLKDAVDGLIALTEDLKQDANVQQDKHAAINSAQLIASAIQQAAFRDILSANSPVVTILRDASDTLRYVQQGDILSRPLELVEQMTRELQEIEASVRIGDPGQSSVVEAKLVAIEKGLTNLQKAGSKKGRIKKGASTAVNYIPLASTFILKIIYGILNISKASHPPPEITGITLDPNTLKLTATLDSTIEGAFKELKNIKWERKVKDKWELINNGWKKENSTTDNTELVFNKLADLTNTIRAKLYYDHGYTSKEFNISSLPPVEIKLSSNEIPEISNAAAAVTIGAFELSYREGVTIKEVVLSLSDADKDLFQIGEIDGKQLLQIQAGKSLDYESIQDHQISITVTATTAEASDLSTAKDSQKSALSYPQSLTIKVTNVNEAPLAILLTPEPANATIPDPAHPQIILLTKSGNSDGQTLGSLSAADPEGDSLTFALDTADGIDNLDIDGNTLKLITPLAEEVEISITATDPEDLSVSKTFTIKIPQA